MTPLGKLREGRIRWEEMTELGRRCMLNDIQRQKNKFGPLADRLNVAGRKPLRTVCIHGHKMTPDNLFEWNGLRFCRECRKNYSIKAIIRECAA